MVGVICLNSARAANQARRNLPYFPWSRLSLRIVSRVVAPRPGLIANAHSAGTVSFRLTIIWIWSRPTCLQFWHGCTYDVEKLWIAGANDRCDRIVLPCPLGPTGSAYEESRRPRLFSRNQRLSTSKGRRPCFRSTKNGGYPTRRRPRNSQFAWRIGQEVLEKSPEPWLTGESIFSPSNPSPRRGRP